jgi:hypothetical protein
MEAYGFPKATDTRQVRALVRNGANVAVMPVVDRGTAEWVAEREGRFVLDFTEGAAKAVGGRTIKKDGKLAGVSGLDSLEFALVPLPQIDMKGKDWKEVRQAAMKLADEKRLDSEALNNLILVARYEHAKANAETAKP